MDARSLMPLVCSVMQSHGTFMINLLRGDKAANRLIHQPSCDKPNEEHRDEGSKNLDAFVSAGQRKSN